MAVTYGSVVSVDNKRSSEIDPLQIAQVLFFLSGTYAQANGSEILGVDAAIAASRRNGSVVTLLSATVCQLGTPQTDPALYMGLMTIAVSGSNITCHVTQAGADGVVDLTDEYPDATALPVGDVPFGLLVSFTESLPPS